MPAESFQTLVLHKVGLFEEIMSLDHLCMVRICAWSAYTSISVSMKNHSHLKSTSVHPFLHARVRERSFMYECLHPFVHVNVSATDTDHTQIDGQIYSTQHSLSLVCISPSHLNHSKMLWVTLRMTLLTVLRNESHQGKGEFARNM